MRGPQWSPAKIAEPDGPGLLALRCNRVLDPHHRAAGSAGRTGEPVDGGDDLARLRDLRRLAGHHEAVLQIDDDQRGARRVKIFERMQSAAARQRALDGIGRNRDLVQCPLLSLDFPYRVSVGSLNQLCVGEYTL
jgi:hypothetical protein